MFQDGGKPRGKEGETQRKEALLEIKNGKYNNKRTLHLLWF